MFHTVFIPVMGTGFTADSPLKVAPWGISSVVSLVDDILLDQLRCYHSEKRGIKTEPVDKSTEDARAERIRGTLNFYHDAISEDIEKLRSSSIDDNPDVRRYFEMLPECELRNRYFSILTQPRGPEREIAEKALLSEIQPGRIDVNIMTKLDRDQYKGAEKADPKMGDAMSALRGFATSKLQNAGIVFSAGLNPRLYSYIAEFPDFFPDESGCISKQVILKVSDYRSAEIQGRFLARKGIWVSEFRIESGVNCGGHAFIADGKYMGGILEEFVRRREELSEKLFKTCQKACPERYAKMPETRLTAQGGVNTMEEHSMLMNQFKLDGVGWGSPFLLVKEVTTMDDGTREKLAKVEKEDIYLSGSSPLGVPFWNLKSSGSEEKRRERIERGKPGSPCPKRYLALSDEFGNPPLCPASYAYLRKKLNDESLDEGTRDKALGKSCICHDLGGGATLHYGIQSDVYPAVCPGPSLTWFSGEHSLNEMLDHIYGRNPLRLKEGRPHFFINELNLHLDRAEEMIEEDGMNDSIRSSLESLNQGVEYYKDKADELFASKKQEALGHLKTLEDRTSKLLNH